eukprot:351107-Chlamydomonas_euryale.AAC.2
MPPPRRQPAHTAPAATRQPGVRRRRRRRRLRLGTATATTRQRLPLGHAAASRAHPAASGAPHRPRRAWRRCNQSMKGEKASRQSDGNAGLQRWAVVRCYATASPSNERSTAPTKARIAALQACILCGEECGTSNEIQTLGGQGSWVVGGHKLKERVRAGDEQPQEEACAPREWKRRMLRCRKAKEGKEK